MKIFWFAGISWSPDVELMTVKCWPFCLACELLQSIITAVQILPSPDVKQAMRELQHFTCISHRCKEFQQGLSLFALNMQQRVMCANRGNRVYSDINNEYTAAPLPHTGSSIHLTLLMNTVYTPRVRKEPPVGVDVIVWAQEAIPILWAAWSAFH